MGISGMFGFFFCEGPVTCFADATKSDTDKFAKWHRKMLERGIYLAPSQYEAGFTSLTHTEEDIDSTIAAAREVFAELWSEQCFQLFLSTVALGELFFCLSAQTGVPLCWV